MILDELIEAVVKIRELERVLKRVSGRTFTIEIKADGIKSGDAWFHRADVEGLIFVLSEQSR